jgi:hypothetical protein
LSPAPIEQAIASSSDESVAPSADSWLTLKEVAAAIGMNLLKGGFVLIWHFLARMSA